MSKSIDVDRGTAEGMGTRLMGGVSVPDSPLITEALEYAQTLYDPYLFNHAMRSWLFAAKIGQSKGLDCDLEVVAVGTILHDIGLSAAISGSNRFEVNGADAARSFVKDRGISNRRAQLIWDLVALNSTVSIALHKEAEVAVGTMGIGLDYGGVLPRADPISRHDRNSPGIPTSQNEDPIRGDVLPPRSREAGDKLRQLSARLRRALRARLQADVDRRLVDECTV